METKEQQLAGGLRARDVIRWARADWQAGGIRRAIIVLFTADLAAAFVLAADQIRRML